MEDRWSGSGYPEGRQLLSFVTGRQRTGQIWKTLFLAATVVGIIALLALLYNVIDDSFGFVAYQNEIDPETLTLGYYKEQVLAAPRTATSEDDETLVNGVIDRPSAISFFGYAYYHNHQDRLKLISVDGLAPSPQTVATGQYSLTRPLYIYTSAQLLQEKPQLAAFAKYYLQHANDRIEGSGYFAVPEAELDDALRTLADASAADLDALNPGAATGNLSVDGSSTLGPLTQKIGEAFEAAGFGGQVQVSISGTAAGFTSFCAGQVDLVNASRPATREEVLACRKAGRELLQLRAGTDALAIVTSGQNDFLTNLTTAQIQHVFTKAEQWADIDPSFPAKPVLHFIPGTVSGTLDFFVSSLFPSTLEAAPPADKLAMLEQNLSAGRMRALAAETQWEQRTGAELVQLLTDEVVKPRIAAVWTLSESLLARERIVEETLQIPNATLDMRSWVTGSFLTSPQSSKPELAGVRTAILGSLWVTLIAFVFSVPLGVGAAIYLEEYGGNSRLAQLVETNINNLAGVPSIIYGMLGLAVFVRVLESLTSGKLFGMVDATTANGRTVLSAGLTIGLLILPLIIINAREAIRAVPHALREAGYGLGATKWQTISAHVLPNAIPGILTGVILAISRALGETAPLVVVGASTFIVVDPNGPFAKFTTLPIQIYQWTARPQAEFQHLAAGAILVLLVLLLAMNATAILLRNKYARSY